jgi:glutaredoxin
MPLGEVVLYVRPDCPSCEDVRRDLRLRGLAWREVDTTDPAMEPRREQLMFSGYLQAPVLCAAGYAMIGYDRVRVGEILDAHEQRLKRLSHKHEDHEDHEEIQE